MKTYPLIPGNVWRSIRDDLGHVAGTYRLRLWNEALTGFSPIQRLLGIDREGTLYIGTSKDLPNRIGTLKKAVCAAYREHEGYIDPTAHGVGRMMSKLFTDTFVFERLCVELQTYLPVEGNEFYYYAEEWRLLSEYAEHFGEFPPLNGPKPSRVTHAIASAQPHPITPQWSETLSRLTYARKISSVFSALIYHRWLETAARGSLSDYPVTPS